MIGLHHFGSLLCFGTTQVVHSGYKRGSGYASIHSIQDVDVHAPLPADLVAGIEPLGADNFAEVSETDPVVVDG